MTYQVPQIRWSQFNYQSIPQNARSGSLKPLVEHFYLATGDDAAGCATKQYQVSKRKRSRCPPKVPESQALLCTIPQGKVGQYFNITASMQYYDVQY